MPQSYKVFIGSSFIQVGNEPENGVVFNRKLINPNAEELALIIQELEQPTDLKIHVSGILDQVWVDFKSHFKVVEAAGGFVSNAKGDWLFIHRNGRWDLPKGKLEKGETKEKCAVREVAEECGIAEPSIIVPLSTTYHTYKLKNQHILKPTYWYLMKSSDGKELVPQREEGILEVKWVSTSEAQQLASASFGSIKQVVEEGLLAAH